MTDMNINEFCTKHHITSTHVEVDSNPNMPDQSMTHYKVTLRRPGRQMTVRYSMGSALTEEPETARVLDTLAFDAGDLENAPDFEDWANQYGWDTDSHKAYQTFHAIEKQTKQLKRFIGDLYDTLLWHTERC